MIIINTIMLVVSLVFITLILKNINGTKGIELRSCALQRAASAIVTYHIGQNSISVHTVKHVAEVNMHELYLKREEILYSDLFGLTQAFNLPNWGELSAELLELATEFEGPPKEKVIMADKAYASSFFMGVVLGCEIVINQKLYSK